MVPGKFWLPLRLQGQSFLFDFVSATTLSLSSVLLANYNHHHLRSVCVFPMSLGTIGIIAGCSCIGACCLDVSLAWVVLEMDPLFLLVFARIAILVITDMAQTFPNPSPSPYTSPSPSTSPNPDPLSLPHATQTGLPHFQTPLLQGCQVCRRQRCLPPTFKRVNIFVK
jgi:hypothetical protein